MIASHLPETSSPPDKGELQPQLSLDSPGGLPGLASPRWHQPQTKSQLPHHLLGGQGFLGVCGFPGASECHLLGEGLWSGGCGCRENIRGETEIGRERPRAVNNTVGRGKQRTEHTKNCIQTTQMTVILICKCLPSWKSCHK